MVLLPAKAVRVTLFDLWKIIPKINQFLHDQEQEHGLYETYPDVLLTVLEQFKTEDHAKVRALFKIV